MLVERLWNWPNIDPEMGQCLVFAGVGGDPSGAESPPAEWYTVLDKWIGF